MREGKGRMECERGGEGSREWGEKRECSRGVRSMGEGNTFKCRRFSYPHLHNVSLDGLINCCKINDIIRIPMAHDTKLLAVTQHRPAQHRPAQHRPAQHRPAQQRHKLDGNKKLQYLHFISSSSISIAER